jgi:hypothetical protein
MVLGAHRNLAKSAICAVAFCIFSAPALAEPRVLTVDYVVAHIAELHGKTIQLRGEINECESLDCAICSDGTATSSCLGLSLYADRAGRNAIEELYRFATVTIEARIDAACALGYDPARGRVPGEIFFCTDRAPDVVAARVLRVEKRRSATEGRFSMYGGWPLRPATDQEGDPILAAWKTQQQRLYPDEPATEVAVFRIAVEDRYRTDTGYRLCVCLKDSCSGKWPSKSGQMVHSPGNPYECHRADQSQTDWIFSF